MRRIAMPRTWPLKRKGISKFVVQPRGGKESSLALLVVIRDMLQLAKTRKEARQILKGKVLVNNKRAIEDAFPVNIFDIVSLPEIKKHFILLPKGKKLVVEEVAEKDAFTKVFKIIGKKIMNKGKIQYNLFGGKNFISDIQVRVNDSLLWDLKQNKTVKHLPLKENAKAIIVAGRNVGVEGVIIKIKGDNINIKTKDKTLEVPIKNIWVVG